jgi:hypothetical protein
VDLALVNWRIELQGTASRASSRAVLARRSARRPALYAIGLLRTRKGEPEPTLCQWRRHGSGLWRRGCGAGVQPSTDLQGWEAADHTPLMNVPPRTCGRSLKR